MNCDRIKDMMIEYLYGELSRDQAERSRPISRSALIAPTKRRNWLKSGSWFRKRPIPNHQL